MSHLGRRLSALIDGELGNTERDQVYAHLVSCEECRAEAAALRTLKRRVHGLGERSADAADGALTRRLIALAALGEPAEPRPRFLTPARGRGSMAAFSGAGTAIRQPAWDEAPAWSGGEPAIAGDEADLAPAALPAGRGRGHARYVVAGAVAALAVGLGAASFAAGGSQPGRRIVPEVDVYSFEHAVTTGQVPIFQLGKGLQAKRTGLTTRP